MGNAVNVKFPQWNISNIHKVLKLDLFNHQLRCECGVTLYQKVGPCHLYQLQLNESKEEQTLMF